MTDSRPEGFPRWLLALVPIVYFASLTVRAYSAGGEQPMWTIGAYGLLGLLVAGGILSPLMRPHQVPRVYWLVLASAALLLVAVPWQPLRMFGFVACLFVAVPVLILAREESRP